jgi:hypothetical protein
MKGVRHEYVHPVRGQAICDPCDTYLIVPREDKLVVVNKAVVVMAGYVWGIEKHQIARDGGS